MVIDKKRPDILKVEGILGQEVIFGKAQRP